PPQYAWVHALLLARRGIRARRPHARAGCLAHWQLNQRPSAGQRGNNPQRFDWRTRCHSRIVPAMALDPRDYPVEELKLSNGRQIRLLPERTFPIATLYSFFRVGSRNERPGIT